MSIEELKQILFQGGCYFLQIGIECPPKEGEHCQECIDEVVDELIRKIREESVEEFIEKYIHYMQEKYGMTFDDEWKDLLYVANQLKEKKDDSERM